MKYKHLKDSYFYENSTTGSTALGSEWREEFVDFFESQHLDIELAWLEWGGDCLSRSTLNPDGTWE